MKGIRITGWGIAVPDKVVTNDDMALSLDTSNEWIVERTGIRERHIGGTTSGLAIEAAQAALAKAGRTAEEIDHLVLATTTPDGIVPGTAPTVQHGIGMKGGAFDLNAACSGFVYGLVTVAGLIAVGSGPVLLVGSETLSKITDMDDRKIAIIVGDGAGAVVVEPVDGPGALAELEHELRRLPQAPAQVRARRAHCSWTARRSSAGPYASWSNRPSRPWPMPASRPTTSP